MSAPIIIEGGITIETGITIGSGSGGGTPGVNNVVGYNEMPPPIVAGVGLEDPTATVNGSVGFTINNDANTGVAIQALSVSNQVFFSTYGVGVKTVTWGPGSTVASSSVNVIQNSGSLLVMLILGQSGPATYNYPFTF